MKKKAQIGGMTLALCGMVLAHFGAAEARQSAGDGPGFKIAGTAVNAITGAPLAGARVTLADTRIRARMIGVVTGASGHFEFARVPEGKYSLQGARRGYISAAYEQHEQYSTAIVTGPDYATENLVLKLTPTAMITGHVTDESGEPIRGASVGLFREDHNGGMTRIERVNNATCDDRGYYEFSLLRPGTYFVSVHAKPWFAIHPSTAAETPGNSTPRVLPGLDVTYPTTYYGGATESERATPIAVNGGDRVEIDVRLNPVPALHIIFRVPEGPAGEPARFQPPVLEKHNFDSREFVPTNTHMDVPGVYELTGVPQGKYTLRFSDPNTGQMAESGDVELMRDGQEVSESQGEPLGSVKVTAKMPAEEPLPKQYAMGLQNAKGRVIAYLPGNATGEAAFWGIVPGKYSLLCVTQEKRYAVVRTSSAAGATDGHEVNVTAGAELELTAWLAAGVVSVEGSVQKNGKPVAGVMVALLPNDPQSHLEYFRRDQSDFDGTFTLQNVFPGTYTIVAVEDAWGFDWLQSGALARYVQHGQNVIVGAMLRGMVHLPEAVEVQGR